MVMVWSIKVQITEGGKREIRVGTVDVLYNSAVLWPRGLEKMATYLMTFLPISWVV